MSSDNPVTPGCDRRQPHVTSFPAIGAFHWMPSQSKRGFCGPTKVPCLSLTGEQDEQVGHDVEALVGAMSNLRTDVLPGLTHAAAMLDPSFGAHVRSFLMANESVVAALQTPVS